jgi:uncharacterized protein YndB with AHSA1/START domain
MVERVFDAPRALVFQMWSEPRHLKQWWGPSGWTLPVCEIDFRPGGTWFYGMKGPDGMESWGRATYREIVEPERIVYVDAFADAQGNVLAGMPLMVNRIEFLEQDGKTKIRSMTEFASEAELEQTLAMGMVEGLTETWDRLEQYLTQKGSTMSSSNSTFKSTMTMPSDREIVMSRVVSAPPALVYKAFSDPAIVSQWWGMRASTTIVDKFDFRVGGAWRFIEREAGGEENAFRGEFREIVPGERVTQTFEWEGMPGHIIVDTMTLEDLGGGKTRITTTSHFASQEDRDGMIAAGMEGGANESWDRLEEWLQAQQA